MRSRVPLSPSSAAPPASAGDVSLSRMTPSPESVAVFRKNVLFGCGVRLPYTGITTEIMVSPGGKISGMFHRP